MSGSLPGHDETTLAAAAKRGDERAYTELVRQHKAALYRFIRAHVGDADEAYDVLQDTFIAAWSAIGRFDVRRPFSAWVRRIALNKCRDWGRRRKVRRFFFTAESLDKARAGAIPAAPTEASEEQAEDEARAAQLEAAIAALPAPLKEPLILTAIDGLSHQAAGAILGLTPKAVEMRVYRARRMLVETLQKQFRT